MGIAVSSAIVINDDRKGIFESINPGQYTDNNRPTSPVAGDIIYNTGEEAPQVWNGTKWETL